RRLSLSEMPPRRGPSSCRDASSAMSGSWSRLRQQSAARHHLLKARAESGNVGGQQPELALGDAEHRHCFHTADGRIPRDVAEERHLAEALAGAQRREDLLDGGPGGAGATAPQLGAA